MNVRVLTKELAFYGGGHYNHTFFWENLQPPKEGGGVFPDKDVEISKMIM